MRNPFEHLYNILLNPKSPHYPKQRIKNATKCKTLIRSEINQELCFSFCTMDRYDLYLVHFMSITSFPAGREADHCLYSVWLIFTKQMVFQNFFQSSRIWDWDTLRNWFKFLPFGLENRPVVIQCSVFSVQWAVSVTVTVASMRVSLSARDFTVQLSDLPLGQGQLEFS